ncbi:MAG: hypothetical protein JXR94_04685, partial [Candidatus Hydrogenedentes bacterium]|nr:hypothetical protein [Candidatus Hydrogenedentota bacterium]
DGTNHAVYWGNNTWSPGAVVDARIIPGTQRVLCTFTSCHDRPWGAIAILDRRLGIDDRAGVVRTWPASAMDLVWEPGLPRSDTYGFDLFKRVNPKYEDPYPLSDRYFLCSRAVGEGERMGLYLLDVFGNETLLHVEGPGCYEPMPLGPRPRPGAIPSRRNFDGETGTFYVVDVYRGTHMEGVEPGSVRFLRVVESPEKRFWTRPAWNGQGQEAPAMNWHDFCNKRILGTAPVESDGSACFEAPADRFLFFQLLDAKGMMIQSMRSGTMLQPGERTGCIGCHEERRGAAPVPAGKMPMALERPPSRLAEWYGPPRVFNYLTEVQPVFDRHCVRCHDYGKAGAAALILAGDRDLTFNASYTELWRKGAIKAVGGGPAEVQPAYSWGSHASKLMQVVRAGHKGLELSAEDLDRLITWIDLNAPYYPHYGSAYPDGLSGRAPLTGPEMERLAKLAGMNLKQLADNGHNPGPQVSFDRPELSPCLASFENTESPEYQEALAIIRTGRERLEQHPRADAPAFEMCPTDAARERKYTARRDIELRNRDAIRTGAKVYDE